MNRTSLEITRKAQAVFGNTALAEAWLDRPSALFGGLSPRQAAADPRTRTGIMRQLNWFEGARPAHVCNESLIDVLNDPMINLVLRRAGSGPEDLLLLCESARNRKQAA